MEAWIGIAIAAGFALFEFLRTHEGRRIELPDEPARPALPGGEESWLQLCEVDDVRVLFKARSPLGPDPARLRMRHSGEQGSTLFEAVSTGLRLPKWTVSGDPAFDAQVSVGGDPLRVAAGLDQATRQCLLRLFDESVAAHDGRVVTLVSSLPTHEILKACPELMTLAERVSSKRTPEERRDALLRNIHADPVPDVRARNLRVLLENYSEDPALVRTAYEALESPDPRLRLIAATLAPAGLDAALVHEALLELARGAHAAVVRMHALEALARSSEPFHGLREELRKFMRDDSELVRATAFALLSERGWQPEGGTLFVVPGEGGELSVAAPSGPPRKPQA